jgi:hypothetical protein
MSRTMRTVPLIGGPRDGAVMNIHDGDDTLEVAHFEQFVPPVTGIYRYRRELISGKDDKVHIFVGEELAIDEALKRLVKGYRRPRP